MAGTVQSVDHAMKILRALLERGEAGATELAHDIGVVPSTAHRILTTMAAHGVVTRTSDRRFAPGPVVAGAHRDATSLSAFLPSARPALRHTFDLVGETVHLLVLVGIDVQFVDGIESLQALRVGLRLGARMPAYCTSGGKAILAGMEPPAVDALHAGGLPPWPGQENRSLVQLHTELAAVRARGVAVNVGESEPGVVALGVAIQRPGSSIRAALVIAVPRERYRAADQRALAMALRSGAALAAA